MRVKKIKAISLAFITIVIFFTVASIGTAQSQSIREEVEAAERKEESSRRLEHQRKQDVISRINLLRKHGLIISCPSQYDWIFYQGIINAITDTSLNNPHIVVVATYSAEKNIITWSKGLSRYELHVDNMNIYEKQDDTFNGFIYKTIKFKLIQRGNF